MSLVFELIVKLFIFLLLDLNLVKLVLYLEVFGGFLKEVYNGVYIGILNGGCF